MFFYKYIWNCFKGNTGKLLRDWMERIWGFPSAHTDTVLNGEANLHLLSIYYLQEYDHISNWAWMKVRSNVSHPYYAPLEDIAIWSYTHLTTKWRLENQIGILTTYITYKTNKKNKKCVQNKEFLQTLYSTHVTICD